MAVNLTNEALVSLNSLVSESPGSATESPVPLGTILEELCAAISAIAAVDVSYDNVISGLAAGDIQDAIDEIAGIAAAGLPHILAVGANPILVDGAKTYLAANRTTKAIDIGNTSDANPVNILGAGQVTVDGNIDADGGLDVPAGKTITVSGMTLSGSGGGTIAIAGGSLFVALPTDTTGSSLRVRNLSNEDKFRVFGSGRIDTEGFQVENQTFKAKDNNAGLTLTWLGFSSDPDTDAGAVTVRGSKGGSASVTGGGKGGRIQLLGDSGGGGTAALPAGIGTEIFLTAGRAGSANTGPGERAGDIFIETSFGSGTGRAGNIEITGGNNTNGGSSGAGGSVLISGGPTWNLGPGKGGSVHLDAGTGNGTGDGGDMRLLPGRALGGGTHGWLHLGYSTFVSEIRIGQTTVPIGFHGVAPVAQETVTGSKASGAALADLLTKLANKGLIVDGSSA